MRSWRVSYSRVVTALIVLPALVLLVSVAGAQVPGDGTVSFDRALGVGVDSGGAAFENCTSASTCQAGSASGAAGGMNFPVGVAVDADGRILVADTFNHRIDRFTVAGDGTVSFDRAFGIGVDTGAAAFENCTTASVCQAGSASGAAGGMNGPFGVAVDADGRILVGDLNNHRIDRFTVAGDGTVSFDRAFGIAVDGGAGAFESCTTASTCQAGTASGAAGGMNNPRWVAVDADGRILVADQNNHRIDRFTVAGDGTVSFDRAFGIAVDGGAGAFESCTTASTCQAGTASGAAGGMNVPIGVAVDADGRILVADFSNQRVDRFTVAGDGTVSFDRAFGVGVDSGGAAFENCTSASTCQAGTASGAAGGMRNPLGVAVDADGRILVANETNHRVDRFTVAGDGTVSFDRAFGVGVDSGGAAFENCTTASTCQTGTASAAAGGVSQPFGVAVDADGRILVADPGNHRIDRFTSDDPVPPPPPPAGTTYFPLTVTKAGTGSGHVGGDAYLQIDCGSNCSSLLAASTFGVLVPTADAGSVFSGWNGDCLYVEADGCRVHMTSAKSVSATFELADPEPSPSPDPEPSPEPEPTPDPTPDPEPESFDVSISLDLVKRHGNLVARGNVSSVEPSCMQGVTVDIVRIRNQQTIPKGSDVTNANGRYRVPLGTKKGTYMATAAAHSPSDLIECLGAESGRAPKRPP